jgi:hypothetical protein
MIRPGDRVIVRDPAAGVLVEGVVEKVDGDWFTVAARVWFQPSEVEPLDGDAEGGDPWVRVVVPGSFWRGHLGPVVALEAGWLGVSLPVVFHAEDLVEVSAAVLA